MIGLRRLDQQEAFAFELLGISHESEAAKLAAWLRKNPHFLARVTRGRNAARLGLAKLKDRRR